MKRYFSALFLVFITGLFVVPSTALFASVANFGQNTKNLAVGSVTTAASNCAGGTTTGLTNSGASVTLKVSGKRPVYITSSGNASSSRLDCGNFGNGGTADCSFFIYRDGAQILSFYIPGGGSTAASYPSSSLSIIDSPSQGSHTYSIYLLGASSGACGGKAEIQNIYLQAMEL